MKNAIMNLFAVVLVMGFSSGCATAEEPNPATNLVGVWEAKQIFGPDLKGTLVLSRSGDTYIAEIGGFKIPGIAMGRRLEFSFPGEKGSFRAQMENGELTGRGHWVQPGNVANGNPFLSPVTLTQDAGGAWVGQVIPLQDEFSVYLVIQENAGGGLTGYLKNPDRNVGLFVALTRITLEGSAVTVYAKFRGRGEEFEAASGQLGDEGNRLSLYFGFAPGTFDFSRAGDDSNFYARGKNPEPYSYVPPTITDDGWEVGTLEEAGIAFGPLKEMLEKEIFPAPESVNSHDLHGVLIARGGKLVFEEYFHGYNRDLPHDTRSASKSLAATLFGAAVNAGLVEGEDIKVYETIRSDQEAPEPRKASMTARHLLTQNSGFYCDDNDYDAPGNEEIMQNQEAEPDWYKYTLDLPMAYDPGEKAIYCSANSNLIGNVVSAASGKSLEVLFQDLIAGPMNIKRYHMNLQPTGAPYMGGGIQWLPREFMKLGQLHLSGGLWGETRIISEDWAKAATSSQVQIGDRGYGYQWWVQEFPYKDRTITAFYAGGNGGQVVAVVPELDLVVAFYGGNYSDRILFKSQNVLFPEYILRAVAEGGE